MNDVLSDTFDQEWGVPQGACLGLLLFVLYFSKFFEITGCYLPNVHVYGNDTRLHMSFSPYDIDEQLNTLSAIEDCITAIRSRMSEDKLKLNEDKTEFLLVRSNSWLRCALKTSNLVVLKYLLLPVLGILACGLIPA